MKVFSRTPLNITEVHIPRGQVCLIPNRCKGCGLCIEFCPQDVLCITEERNAKGYHYPTIAPGKEAGCVHCEFCTLVCPEFAIFTLPFNEASYEK
jgi:2-oxoglutarate ferredoxin oxidoreductase subunit delta